MIAHHPLQPFLPAGAHLLMLGSFPPPEKRWSMQFFYPNMQNDMWRIFGLLYFANPQHFVIQAEKRFDREKLVAFLTRKGVAIFDAATIVNRLQGNASDRFLEVVQPTDVAALLRQLPTCKAVVTTGEKATVTFCEQFHITPPNVGTFVTFDFESRPMRLYRMPSSSRAYPLKLEKKAAVYGQMLVAEGLLDTLDAIQE